MAESSSPKVIIVGAGFSGLTTAFYLARAGHSVEIFESSARVGGLLGTLRTSHGPVETAANGLLNSALVEDLFRELGVPLAGTRREARKRFIYRAGRFRRWPIGFTGSLRVAWFLLRYIIARATVAPREGESISSFGDRVLGTEASKYLLSTALQGIYAGDPSRMSARLILGRYFSSRKANAHFDRDFDKSNRENQNRKPSIRGTVAPPNGMGELIDALEKWLRAKGVAIHLNVNSAAIKTAIESQNKNAVIIATNPRAAAEYVDPARANLLRQIEMRPITTTTAFFDTTDERSRGFGILFLPGEGKFLGVLKNSFIFENRGINSETWMKPGASQQTIAKSAPQDLVETIVEERARVFGLKQQPKEAVATAWPEGIPHYTLELERAIPQLESPVNNVFLMGNYLGDLGLAKILERASRWPTKLKRETK